MLETKHCLVAHSPTLSWPFIHVRFAILAAFAFSFICTTKIRHFLELRKQIGNYFHRKMQVFRAVAKWESEKVSYGQEAKWTESRQHYKIINRVLLLIILL